MISLPRLVGAMSCSFLLCLGLSTYPASAADEMKADDAIDRIGGQAGLEGEKGKLEGLADPSTAGRIGGQAGLEGEKGKLEGLTDPSTSRRIGGQAGMEGEKGKLEGLADPSSVKKNKSRVPAKAKKGKAGPKGDRK